jgi:hypothetical protein
VGNVSNVIEHVPGETNVWGDLLSRWGAGPVTTPSETARMARLAVVGRVSPLQDEEFVWPNETEIRETQRVEYAKNIVFDEPGAEARAVTWSDERQMYLTGAAAAALRTVTDIGSER